MEHMVALPLWELRTLPSTQTARRNSISGLHAQHILCVSGVFFTEEATPDSEHLTVYCNCLKLLLKDKKVLELTFDVYFMYFGRKLSFLLFVAIFQTKAKTGIFT